MRHLFSTLVALGMFMVPSVATFATTDAATPAAPRREAHHYADFAKARALAPLMAPMLPPMPRVPETDGLSRHDEDCNYGCIDH